MFHSYAIIHPAEKVRSDYINKLLTSLSINTIDIYNLDTDSVKVANIRQLIPMLNRKPYASDYKAAIIQAEKLTFAAQQALLKTVEEPPRNSIIIFSSSRLEVLLPTIISRCVIKRIFQAKHQEAKSIDTQQLKFWQTLISQNPGERMQNTSILPQKREDLRVWLIDNIANLRALMLNKYPSEIDQLKLSRKQIACIIRKLLAVLSQVEKNITIKLALDHLWLQIPKVNTDFEFE